jgi:L-alanine-DL-glutamate epimerase-like enolase superfamily enzyme
MAIRSPTIGSNITLMVDANMRWRVDQAIRAARALAPERPGHGVTLDWAALEEHRDRG